MRKLIIIMLLFLFASCNKEVQLEPVFAYTTTVEVYPEEGQYRKSIDTKVFKDFDIYQVVFVKVFIDGEPTTTGTYMNHFISHDGQVEIKYRTHLDYRLVYLDVINNTDRWVPVKIDFYYMRYK